ncbi:MAG TPA: DUF5069 domain-containing protein [Chthoniobacterales bacterium]|nr:DUF5069 domain-containing protein [Chthoniobacterales bacterium]
MNNDRKGKDLTKESPRSPKERLGEYVILARTLDKCRALLWGNIGEYHFDCPLDNMLFGPMGINANEFKAEVERGATDEEMVKWMQTHSSMQSPEEVRAWSEQMMGANPYHNPEKRDWFVEQVSVYKLDPATTTLFDWLDVDDRESYKQAA